MHIIAVGLNHTTATVELREKISISDVDLDEVLDQLRNTSTILESVVLSTCNRTEVYAVVSSYKAGEDYLTQVLSKRAGMKRAELDEFLYRHRGDQAVVHLFEVAGGMDSLVLGETQILGQVRSAYLAASDMGNTGLLLNRLFRLAIQLGKRAQTETDIGKNPVSVSYAAVQLAKKIYGDLSDHRVLVLGAGKMSALSAQYLHGNGVQEITVVNRTLERAKELAAQIQGLSAPWSDLMRQLKRADIVISSTGSKEHVLGAAGIEQVMRQRHYRPMVFIDIAVPRDIDPEGASIRNVYLYDIDDLQGVVAANLEERQRQAVVVGQMIEGALHEYSTWLSEQEVVPLITAIRDKGSRIQSDVMDSLHRKLPNLSEREQKLIHKHMMSIVNQLLRDPVKNIKELASAPGASRQIHVFAQLFGISSSELAEASRGNILAESSAEFSKMDEASQIAFREMVRQWRDSAKDEVTLDVPLSLHPVLR